jgi:hypothetical protein
MRILSKVERIPKKSFNIDEYNVKDLLLMPFTINYE